MALGGGNFITQNKVLPGTYINFVSAAHASAALSDRGYAAMPLVTGWGVEDEVFAVTSGDFQKNSLEIFGYPYTHEKMKGLRDLFANASTLYAYRLDSGGTKASNTYAEALYGGTRGNSLRVGIQQDIDDETKWDVTTYLDSEKVDIQTVSGSGELVPNGYVSFKAGFTLAAVAGDALTGGTDGGITGNSYQAFLDKIESYSFNTLGVVTTDDTVKKLFVSFTKRLRDEMGIKFQLVVYGYREADYMGVVSIKNKCLDGAYKDKDGMAYPDEAAAVYWVTGALAGCKVNASCQNRVYDGEYTVEAVYTQSELASAIKEGEFVFHLAGGSVRVLDDINTMVTVTDTCGEVFKDNQTVRVIDQLANDDAVLFNTKYLGKVPNDEAGRIALWADLVKIRQELQVLRAIENFSETDVKVSQGSTKKSVVVESAVTAVNAMSKLYMTVTVA